MQDSPDFLRQTFLPWVPWDRQYKCWTNAPRMRNHESFGYYYSGLWRSKMKDSCPSCLMYLELLDEKIERASIQGTIEFYHIIISDSFRRGDFDFSTLFPILSPCKQKSLKYVLENRVLSDFLPLSKRGSRLISDSITIQRGSWSKIVSARVDAKKVQP